MSLVKLKITAYKDEKFSSKAGDYSVMLNPDAIKWGRNLKYNEKHKANSSKSAPKYIRTDRETLSFDLVIDGTGVVDAGNLDVTDNINKIKHLVYDYDGNIHRPFFVMINWGRNLTFKGLLSGFDTNYSLFKADGSPLRAKLSLKFQSYTDPVTAAKEENKNSPDMTHLIDVVAGDSLVQLSNSVYGTTDYTIQLAAFNGLNKFRKLVPKTQLVFPPIEQGEVHA
jgi:hypothetical protein